MFRKPNPERLSRINYVFWEWENVISGQLPVEIRAMSFANLKDEVNGLENEINIMARTHV